jgi:hypothetical protein
LNNLNNRCGSCNILKAELHILPAQLEENVSIHVRDVLGYHNHIDKIFNGDLKIQNVDFPAVIYRAGRSNNHSGKSNFWKLYFCGRAMHTKPVILFTKLMKLRIVTKRTKCDSFG